jgi:peroxiredoxin
MSPVPTLHREQIAPLFELSAGGGQTVSRAQFRGRRNLVLVLFGPDDPVEELLEGLDLEAARLEYMDSTVLGIVPAPAQELEGLSSQLSTPFTLLSDPDLHVFSQFTAVEAARPSPAVVVLDRWGAVQCRWVDPSLPTAAEVLDALELIEIACPECSVRHWDPEDWPA